MLCLDSECDVGSGSFSGSGSVGSPDSGTSGAGSVSGSGPCSDRGLGSGSLFGSGPTGFGSVSDFGSVGFDFVLGLAFGSPGVSPVSGSGSSGAGSVSELGSGLGSGVGSVLLSVSGPDFGLDPVGSDFVLGLGSGFEPCFGFFLVLTLHPALALALILDLAPAFLDF